MTNPLFPKIRQRVEAAQPKFSMVMNKNPTKETTFTSLAVMTKEVSLLTNARTDIPKLLEAIDHMDKTLEVLLDYLHSHADDLSGDDISRDKRKTNNYENKINLINDTFARVASLEGK